MFERIRVKYLPGDDTARIKATYAGILSERISCLKLRIAKALLPVDEMELLKGKLLELERLLIQSRTKH